ALPSYYPEGVPRSILEAMAFSLPIVTTDMPGCRETVVHGRNGFLVPPRDSRSLAARLGELMNSSELRTRFGQESLRVVNLKFSETEVVRRVLAELYLLDGDAVATAEPMRMQNV